VAGQNMNNIEIDLLKYISENNDDIVCDILANKPECLLKIPSNMRKEKYILSAISKDIHIFSKLDDNEKTLSICKIAVKKIPRYMENVPKHIKTEEFILQMIDKNGYVIGYLDNPTEEMCMRAVISNPYAIHDIKNPTEKMLLRAIEKGNGIIFSIANPTEKMMSLALKTQGLYNSCRKMPQYYNAVLVYMKKYGSSLKHIRRKLKTYELCKAAIESSPYAIKFVNKSTLKKHPDLIQLASAKWGK
jgi:hypothetical protein